MGGWVGLTTSINILELYKHTKFVIIPWI